ncbi:unnamed protein product [Phyllotreta striolata]|uniref:Uncharacterized protein n=1 Tax=Phyllotreta striolata TaxID=444603 RepID=A0A9N9TPU4_PHYSR|nr:unnamed protein product [Phyllotreta striolata]
MKVKQLEGDFKEKDQEPSSQKQISEQKSSNIDQIKKNKRGRPRKSAIHKSKNEVVKKKILKQRATRKSLKNTIQIDAAQNENLETNQQMPQNYNSNCDNSKCICNSSTVDN